MTVVAQKAVWG